MRNTTDGRRREWNVRIEFHYPRPDGASKMIESLWEPSFQFVAEDVIHLGLKQDAFMLARIVSPTCPDPEFLRACQNICLKTHGKT